MRVESSVTAVSWIPSESVSNAVFRKPFDLGMSHYDDPPPAVLDDIDALLAADAARFVNYLAAWIEVQDGQVVGHGHSGRGRIGSTTLSLGRRDMTFAAVPLPDKQQTQPLGADAVRFEQTTGGRTGVPAPRKVTRPPYLQIAAPLAWSSLSLKLYADGRKEFELIGASPFPRHWVYDDELRLVSKSATLDFKRWFNEAFGRRTPWGDTDSPAFVSAVETALERELSRHIMRSGTEPTIRRLAVGDHLTRQGERADELFLLLDGVLRVDVSGEPLAEIGPGAILGERSILEAGVRTASLQAVTACTVAVAARDTIDLEALRQVAEGHRREEQH